MNDAWIDRIGGLASVTCAVHCGIFSFAPALVAVLGIEALAHEGFEWGFFVTAISFALLAGVWGYRTHGSIRVVAGFVLGALLLSAARLGEAFELFEGGAVLAVCGGFILLGGHVANTLELRSCREECCP
jgi:uncharacterized membrane protein (UPF0136 family)